MLAEREKPPERLEQIRILTNSDFCGVARYDAASRIIRWTEAAGNRSLRYLTMTTRPGHGAAGEAVRYGRLVTRHYREDEAKRADDYMMHAEELLAAAAVPFGTETGGVSGVLLVGRRTSLAYDIRDTTLLLNAAAGFAPDG